MNEMTQFSNSLDVYANIYMTNNLTTQDDMTQEECL